MYSKITQLQIMKYWLSWILSNIDDHTYMVQVGLYTDHQPLTYFLTKLYLSTH